MSTSPAYALKGDRQEWLDGLLEDDSLHGVKVCGEWIFVASEIKELAGNSGFWSYIQIVSPSFESLMIWFDETGKQEMLAFWDEFITDDLDTLDKIIDTLSLSIDKTSPSTSKSIRKAIDLLVNKI